MKLDLKMHLKKECILEIMIFGFVKILTHPCKVTDLYKIEYR
ncbi:hypothetical protein LEP1GSC073_1745 [Leptospira noguchii str. Cascata]|nr:hypothetical protein LEP1GSC073_1745 [Leptospira noguchii str. Cascata]